MTKKRESYLITFHHMPINFSSFSTDELRNHQACHRTVLLRPADLGLGVQKSVQTLVFLFSASPKIAQSELHGCTGVQERMPLTLMWDQYAPCTSVLMIMTHPTW